MDQTEQTEQTLNNADQQQQQQQLTKDAGFTLDADQAEAVQLCINAANRLVPVTGPAGTGKTSLLRHIYHVLVENGYGVAVCSPTGKAAKRIFEATGIRACTIHKLLEFPHPGERDKKTGKPLDITLPKRCREYPLPEDFVLVDEYAMVNTELHRQIVDALKPGACIRMFGDINQLPPIEKSDALAKLPSPFADILQRFKGKVLTTIHRQGEGSGIVENGAFIIKGFSPRRKDDFFMEFTDRPVDKLREIVIRARDNNIDYSTINNQIITPQNKSWIGTHALNAMLQTIFRPEMDGWFALERHEWETKHPVRVRVGDKVVCTQNNYDIGSNDPEVSGLFNGETGIVLEVTEYGEVIIDVGDRVVTVPPEIISEWNNKRRVIRPHRDLQLAYAMTTHKCQGSEYQHIIYVMNKCAFYMLNRKNLYTGVTRARKTATVITDQRSLSTSLANSKPRS